MCDGLTPFYPRSARTGIPAKASLLHFNLGNNFTGGSQNSDTSIELKLMNYIGGD